MSETSHLKFSVLYDNNEEIQKFREYLKIPSIVSDDYDYVPCIEFLENEAKQLGLPVTIFYPEGPTKPIVIMKWEGQIPELPAIVLHSHMDVMPVDEKYWTHPPFNADIDSEGRIFARGSQDMKCNGMQYLAAIRALIKDKVKLTRTILVMFVPDEENLGFRGMKTFMETNDFKTLKIGFVFVEGDTTAGEEFYVFIGERSRWHFKLKISGTSGHGSLFLKDTVGEKVRYMLDKFTDYHTQQIEQNPNTYMGNITSIYLTYADGGIRNNIIPSEMTLGFDCRLMPYINQSKFEQMIRKWMEEAGGGIELVFDEQDESIPSTVLENNTFWNGFKEAMNDLKLTYSLKTCPFSSSSRFFRRIGIPAIGFSALNNTLPLAHEHDEYVAAETYLRGIEIWKHILEKVGNALFIY